jgi:cytochrome P450
MPTTTTTATTSTNGNGSQRPQRPPEPPLRAKVRLTRTLLREPAPALDELRREYGPVVGLTTGPMRMAVVGGPAAMREMFQAGADSYRWGHRFMFGLRFVVGSGSMIVSDGEAHKRRRRSAQGAFSRPRLDAMVPMILRRVDDAVDELARSTAPGAEIDLHPFGRHLIIGITLEAFFGPRVAARVDEISALLESSQAFLEAPAVQQMPQPLSLRRRRRVRADRRAIDRIVGEEIELRRRDRAAARDDLLQALIEDDSLSHDEVYDQAMTAMGAGFDTTSATLAWTLVRAGRSPDVWSRLRAEADRVLGEPGTVSPSLQSVLSELREARNVVHESLRLHPAGLIGTREAARDVSIGGFTIRRGTVIVWSPYLAGRDEDTWTDPLRFDPDRFSDLDADQQAQVDQAWVPFGRGPHMCLGFGLAQMELTLAIARLAQRLDVAARSAEIPRPFGLIVNRPTGGAVFDVTCDASQVNSLLGADRRPRND